MQSNIVAHNTIHNSYHTGVDNHIGGSGTHSGQIIQYNYIYTTYDYGIYPYTCNGIYADADAGLSVANLTIDDNVIYNMTNNGIYMSYHTSNPVIYNNTVWGTNPTYTGYPSAIRSRITRAE